MTEEYSRDDLVHKIMYEVGKAAGELRLKVVEKALEAKSVETIETLVSEGRALLMLEEITDRVLENMRKRGRSAAWRP